MLNARSAFIDNNPNLKCYPTLINKATLHTYALPLIINNTYENKVCISKYIRISIV